MKRFLQMFVLVSVALNVALVFACWSALTRRPTIENAPVAQPAHRKTEANAAQPQTVTNVFAVTNAPRLFDWRDLESDEYPRYVANLRQIGCPEKTIRDIIVADVNELYRHRFRAAFPPTNQVEYWKPGDPLANIINEEQVALLQQFAREKRELVRTLLGSDFGTEMELTTIQSQVFMERLLGFLTPEQRTAMEELERRYAAKVLATMSDSLRGNNDPTKAVLAARDEDTLKVLTAGEKVEYDLRRSQEAMSFRVALGDFELTEPEFRSAFPAMKRFIADAGVPSLTAIIRGDGDERETTQAARQELQKGLMQALGETRFQELLTGTGWNLNTD